MSPAAWGALAAVVGPTLVFVTWLASRRQERDNASSSVMSRTIEGALSTTQTMRLLLVPLEHEITELRNEIALLRIHVTSLEAQVRELGHDPIPPPDVPPFGRIK